MVSCQRRRLHHPRPNRVPDEQRSPRGVRSARPAHEQDENGDQRNLSAYARRSCGAFRRKFRRSCLRNKRKGTGSGTKRRRKHTLSGVETGGLPDYQVKTTNEKKRQQEEAKK